MSFWTRDDTKEWIAQLENRVEDIDYYLNRTVEWCEQNGIWDDEKVFGLAFVTVIWVCHMRGEDVSRREIIEIIGIKDWEDAEDAVMDLGDRLSTLDHDDMLQIVANSLYKD